MKISTLAIVGFAASLFVVLNLLLLMLSSGRFEEMWMMTNPTTTSSEVSIPTRATAITAQKTIQGKTTTSSKSQATSLGDFFQLLCRHNVTHCCRKESRLQVLDELSMTLGMVQIYDQPLPLPTKSTIEDRPLNCSRYQYELRRRRSKSGNSTTTREILNSFRRRRLIFIPPEVNREFLRPVFNGTFPEHKQKQQPPRPMIDVVMVSHELDILQARMHEFNSVMQHYVIVESSYNHRGWKKHRFVQKDMARTDSKFDPFRDKIIYVNIDDCPLYREAVDTERNTGQGVGNNVWSIQESMRECLWPTMAPKLSHLDNSTLVLFSDLDWLPCLDDLRHLSHCQPSPEYGLGTHFRMGLKHKTTTSFALYPPGQELMNERFAVTPLGRIRRDNQLPLRGAPRQTGPQERAMTMHPILCGVHLQLMGSLANVIYREVTHAEGSDLDRLHHLLDGRHYCDIDDAFLREQQERASQHPDYFHWRTPHRQPFEARNVTIISNVAMPPISAEHLQLMLDANVPSALVDWWQWFPFYWGVGTYEMYSRTT